MQEEIKKIIEDALKEDMPSGDITTDNIIPEDESSKAYFIAKEDGIISGIEEAKYVFIIAGGNVNFDFKAKSGDHVSKGQIIGTIEGKTRTILHGERVALNIMQRMSGIATETNRYVMATNGLATILDTRKTTPNMRILEKNAVKDGGGTNHRFCLSDMVMIKDNHIDAAGSITKAVEMVYGKVNAKIEVEVETYDQFLEALATPCDIIMLDNMNNELMQKCVIKNNHLKKLEASGNMSLDRISEVSELGVDFISVGALTHHIKSLDISLKFHKL